MKLEVKLFVSTRYVATLDSKYFVLTVGNVSRVSLFCKRVENDCQLSNGFALNLLQRFGQDYHNRVSALRIMGRAFV